MFVQMVDIFNIPCDCQFVFSNSLYLMNFFHTTLDAVGNILRVPYKSVKYDVSISQGSVSTFYLGEVNMFFMNV